MEYKTENAKNRPSLSKDIKRCSFIMFIGVINTIVCEELGMWCNMLWRCDLLC